MDNIKNLDSSIARRIRDTKWRCLYLRIDFLTSLVSWRLLSVLLFTNCNERAGTSTVFHVPRHSVSQLRRGITR